MRLAFAYLWSDLFSSGDEGRGLRTVLWFSVSNLRHAYGSAGHFDVALVLEQVRYLNLVQTSMVRRAGFSSKFAYPKFVSRFRPFLRYA